jgi:hypothetical protein
MAELLAIAARVIVGWCGVSLLVGGAWVLFVAAIRARDRLAGLGALGLMALGGALLWRALAGA